MKFPNKLINLEDQHHIAFGFGFWINGEYSKYQKLPTTQNKGFAFIDESSFKFQYFYNFIEI